MWGRTFSQRLVDWNQLRAEAQSYDKQTALEKINAWWHQTPWCPYRLHWDNQEDWPNPWEILEDNYYCPLTRALGIMYTIAILGIADQAELIETQEGDHLVIVDGGAYILNWDPTTLNIELPTQVTHRLPISYFADKF